MNLVVCPRSAIQGVEVDECYLIELDHSATILVQTSVNT